jgi:SSS family solute:Na+ symporter
MHFGLLDWAIVIVYVGGSLAAGLYGKKYIAGIADYLVAGRQLGTFIGVATLAATEIGTITFMYNAELGYKTGYSSFAIGLISGVVMIFIGRTGFIVKRLRELRLMTVPEFFEARYSHHLRVLTGFLVATGGLLNMGVFLINEGKFLATISGIPMRYLKLTMVAILILELAYTVLGGMVSVVITDFIQFVALSFATILITLYAMHVAGWHNMKTAVAHTMGAGGFNPFANPAYGWPFLLFQVLMWLAVDTCWQTTAMRTFSTTSPEVSKKVFSWTGFIFLGRGMMPMLWGIAALVIIGPAVSDTTMPMPMMLARILPSGVLGLVAAGMLAATMSVNSSYLLGWSSVISQDIVLQLYRKPMSSRGQVLLNRLANLFVSIFILVWGLYYTPKTIYPYLNISASIFLSGSFVAVLAGLYWKRASVLGGYCAMLLGASSTIPFLVWGQHPEHAPRLVSWLMPVGHVGPASFALAAIGMAVGVAIRPAGKEWGQTA